MNQQKICALLINYGNCTPDAKKQIAMLYQEYGYNRIMELVKKRKIIPFAAKTLSSLDIDKEKWEQVLSQYRARNEKIVDLLNTVYTALENHGVTKITVSENFGALLSSGDDLALFASGDVDNFAPISEKEKIYKAMDSLGFSRTERFSLNNQIAAEFFPPKSFGLPDNFYFSVDFYPLARLKLPCFIKEETFIDWDKSVYYKDTKIRLLSPDSLMYICMLHVSLHSFIRAPDYRLYLDLYNLSKCHINYDMIALWCDKESTKTRAAVASTLSNRIMGTNLPEASDSRAKRLIKTVFDEKNSCLYPEPNKFKILKIDIMCNDKSDICGIFNMLFPDREWMKKTYGNTRISSYIKHFIRMI